MGAVEKSVVVLSCGESLVLSAESEGRPRDVKVGARDCASVEGGFETCSVQDCENVLCFG